MHRSAEARSGDRAPQFAATHIKQKHFADSPSETLSSAEAERETLDSYKESREGIEKLASLWNKACEECNNPTLAWRPSEVSRWSPRLSKFMQEMGVAKASDEEVMARLRLLAGDLEWLSERMGPAFMKYNTDGLLIESFVRFGKKLWLTTEKRLAEERRWTRPRGKSLEDFDITPKAEKMAKIEEDQS